ncbi:hypothetical protein HYG81_00545 [Natrinema zhouii]|uniref:Uncharacterized protein n=1 Tax=Natrinema zhouii TaxID=1710539 RepID=A0A7D6CRC8_9EURY|nr:hypothetical protein [Natrinema zhouii]QLK26150.1 hypothetical protein HYG81_00545 [Natrinema zhouii]
MSVFEDNHELWRNALEHDDVAMISGPPSIETLLEARDHFEQLGNEIHDGVLVISIAMAHEIPRGWVEITGPAVPSNHEEFRPFDDMITITERVDGREALICRSDAIRLDMEIHEPDGVAIDFEQGGSND